MARVGFYQNVHFELHGVMSLAAALEAEGHTCRAFIGSSEADGSVEEFAPDLAAFTCASAHAGWTRETAWRLRAREPGLPILVGGIHPTFSPEALLDGPADAACRGEGESALVEAARRVDRGEGLAGIPNLAVRGEKGIEPAELAPMIQDLDALPDPSRRLYYEHHPLLARNPMKPFFIGRGCPFGCTFCFNRAFRELYRCGSGYVRQRAPLRVVEEILQVQADWGLRRIFFFDDIFTVNRTYTLDFLARYRERVRLPFRCYISVHHQDAELLRALKEAGCFHVEFGVESGNEDYRRKVLRKPITNEQIRAAARNIRGAGLRFSTGNIFRMPGETLDMAMDTVDLNAEIRPDSVLANLFQPYRGLPLTEHGIRIGAIDPERLEGMSFSSFRGSEVDGPDAARVTRLHLLFGLAVRFPALRGLVRGLTRLPLDPLYRVVFWLHYALTYPRRNPMSLGEMAREGGYRVKQFRSFFKE